MPKVISPAMEAKLADAMRPPETFKPGLPAGFTKHKGGKCPVEPDARVLFVIRTSEGLGIAGPMRASEHEWKHSAHDDGLGAVVGYRLAEPGDRPDRRARWPETT